MEALIDSSFRAVRSLATPGMPLVFVLCILTTIGALTGFVLLGTTFFVWLAGRLHHPDIVAGSIALPVIAWFLFPGIMPVFVSFFDNRIAEIIERHEYPATPVHTPTFWPELLHDLRFSAMTIILNILVLPLYLLPVINLFLFYILNGYLLGREFFVMAARRHSSARDAETLRKRHGKTVFAAGIFLTFLATLPIINLFAPFWGIAVMVHLYRRLAQNGT